MIKDMSRFLADHLTDALLSRLAVDHAFINVDRAILIVTVDEHGWPHPAMLSSLELVARDARNVRLAPHHASRTTRNLRTNGRLTIVLADENGVFYIKGDVLPVGKFMAADPNLAKFNMRVDSVLEDVPADDESANVVSGVRVQRGEWDRDRAEAIVRELVADTDERPAAPTAGPAGL